MSCPDRRRRRRSTLVLMLALALAAGAWVAGPRAPRSSAAPTASATRAPKTAGVRQVPAALRFGIYPGGAVGQVGDEEPVTPAEDEARRTAALNRLRASGRTLVLHLYGEWTGAQPDADSVAAATAEASRYAAAGFPVELVVRYRPARPTAASPAAFAAFVGQVTRVLAPNPRVVGLQVANEANVTGSPAAADGAYPGARAALVRGVLAAAAETRRAGRPDLGVGFNWASGGNTGADGDFWRGLAADGGPAFAAAVDWVGVDVYPGTWSHRSANDAAGVRAAMSSTLAYLRGSALPLAGLDGRVALHVSENGFPTGDARDERAQSTLMRAAVRAVDDARERYGVTDYRWFDLRDARTRGGDQEDGYGVLRSDYSPKPAFATLATLIARLGR